MTEPVPTSSRVTPPKPRRRWVNWLLMLVIFVAGAIAGVAFTIAIGARMLHRAVQHPWEAPQRITARLTRRLDLTPEQANRVHEILTTRQKALMNIRRDAQPKVEAELNELDADITHVLDARQQQTWHELLRSFRENWIPPIPATQPE